MLWKEFGKEREDNIMKKRILILGTLYTIKYKNLKGADYDGYCDYTSKKIVIRADNHYNVSDFKRLQNKQLRHEIMVDWIAIQFPKLLAVYKELNILN